MFYCPLNHNAPLLFDTELFIYFPVLPVNPYERLGAAGLLRHDLGGGIKYIATICFPPLSGSDDAADKYSSSKVEELRQQNKYVLCSIILIVSSCLVGLQWRNRSLLSDSDCFVFGWVSHMKTFTVRCCGDSVSKYDSWDCLCIYMCFPCSKPLALQR